MAYFKKCIYVDDVLGVTLLSFLGVIFVLIPPFNEIFIRIPLALSLFFFTPGYAFISAFYPRKNEISDMERFTLSIGSSLVLTVFDSFLISFSPWGYRPAPIVISILGITAFFSIIAIFTRKLSDESNQFSFSINEFLQSIKSNEIDEVNEVFKEASASEKNRRFHRSRSKVKARGLNPRSGVESKKIPLPPELEKGLIIGLVISIILVSGIQVYTKATQEKEIFTVLYLLGPEGKAEGYPTESLINVPITVTVGIENHELQDINYILQMRADGVVITELDIPIESEETWIDNLTYTRREWKNGKSKLEFAIFKEDQGYSPYRSVHLYIQNNNSLSSYDEEKYSDMDLLPKIQNGDMESKTGWNFNSNFEQITGSYVKGSGLNSSSAYGIVNSYNGSAYDYSVNLGEIYQSIECKESTLVVVSAFVIDDFNLSTQVTDTQFKQVKVNGETVWSDGINGDEGWQHLEMPVTLKAGTNILTFDLKQVPGEITPVTILWDNISLKTISDMSSYVSDNNTVETVPPTSKVMELPLYMNKTTFTVSWNGTDDMSGIAYYSIDSSTDGANWETWIPKTTDNLSIFTGKHNQTYYFRSRAVDNAGNEEPEHIGYDARTIVYTEAPKVMLDIYPNPCKTATNFTVTYPVPLQAVTCIVTRDGFESEPTELKSADGVYWTGSYIVRKGDHFYVEALCTDVFGNVVSTFDEILVDSSIPDFEIEIKPEVINTGDIEIKVTPSTVLKQKPSVSISANEKINVTFVSYLDGDYFYTAKVRSEINDGVHKVSVTGYDLSSEKTEGNSTFVVDHSS
jgi:uncharacterized membrane protein